MPINYHKFRWTTRFIDPYRVGRPVGVFISGRQMPQISNLWWSWWKPHGWYTPLIRIHPNVRGGIYNFWIVWTLGQSKCFLSTLKPWMLLNVGWYYSRYSRFISPSPAVKKLSESLPRKTRADSPKGFNSCLMTRFVHLFLHSWR